MTYIFCEHHKRSDPRQKYYVKVFPTFIALVHHRILQLKLPEHPDFSIGFENVLTILFSLGFLSEYIGSSQFVGFRSDKVVNSRKLVV